MQDTYHIRDTGGLTDSNASATMLSLSNLLNPAPSGSIPLQRFSPTPAMPSPATSHTDELAPAPPDRPLLSEFKMTRDSLGPSKTKPRGVVNFYPFENVDGDALREIRRFQVAPFGQILHSCLHIPYNSGKKDFYEKTGRESFEGEYRVPFLLLCKKMLMGGQSSSTTFGCLDPKPSTPSCGTTMSASSA